MSEISNLQSIKIDEKVFDKLDSILRERSKADKTPIRILYNVLNEMKNNVGMNFSYMVDYLIFRKKHEYTFSLSRKQDESVFTVVISEDALEPWAQTPGLIQVSKKESAARNRKAIKTFLDHKVEYNNNIHTFIIILFKYLSTEYVITKINQVTTCDIDSDTKRIRTNVTLLTPDSKVLIVSLS